MDQGLPQRDRIYLAAIQKSRENSAKRNFGVFGLLTESVVYKFAYLNKERISKTF